MNIIVLKILLSLPIMAGIYGFFLGAVSIKENRFFGGILGFFAFWFLCGFGCLVFAALYKMVHFVLFA